MFEFIPLLTAPLSWSFHWFTWRILLRFHKGLQRRSCTYKRPAIQYEKQTQIFSLLSTLPSTLTTLTSPQWSSSLRLSPPLPSPRWPVPPLPILTFAPLLNSSSNAAQGVHLETVHHNSGNATVSLSGPWLAARPTPTAFARPAAFLPVCDFLF